MIWPWIRRTEEGDESRTRLEGREARQRAEQALDQARARRTEVVAVASTMRWFREENHLAEAIRLAMGGKP